ncbi:hypothetical protein QUC32_11665 [Novosphingobium resinovorum]|uniref:hypothetical protein n=1 Tax=Novosphingobium TaxID=165696 RepID=UPI001B3C82A2|nr:MULTISPECIES: hypothetical protein [Novosphingobium]MBF7010328.1 hypothetical protein [Novosphingobium sp. HR1a]WJM28334.1 hypothetical protein QUC32_11665 [Novosphingobium resinovorum]
MLEDAEHYRQEIRNREAFSRHRARFEERRAAIPPKPILVECATRLLAMAEMMIGLLIVLSFIGMVYWCWNCLA